MSFVSLVVARAARDAGTLLLVPHTHAHDGAHGHSHIPARVSERTLRAALILTLAFVTIEALCGWFGPSLALLSDAGHNLADAASLGFSWYALSIANKRSHHGMTFGYHRVGVLAALANAVSLVCHRAADWMGSDRPDPASRRCRMDRLMIGVAGGGDRRERRHRALAARGRASTTSTSAAPTCIRSGTRRRPFGVVIAGVLVETTGQPLADPIVSLLIAGLILFSSYGVLSESATVLLEGTPAGTDMPGVIDAIKGVTGVLDVHDLHVWMVGPGVVACSCHIIVAEQSVREGQQVLRAVVDDLKRRFHITHTTVQVEVEGCEDNDMYCVAERRPSRNSPAKPDTRQLATLVSRTVLHYNTCAQVFSLRAWPQPSEASVL